MPSQLFKKVTRRNPFAPGRIPLLARVYAKAERGHNKSSLWNWVFFAGQKLPFGSVGTFFVTTKNGVQKIRFNAKNTQFSHLYNGLFQNGYEPEVLTLLDILIGKTDVMYDVGSNWGHESIFVASNTKFSGKVYAFEPFPTSYNDLRRCVEDAGLNKIIDCLPLALGDSNGTADMQFSGLLQSGFAYVTKNSDLNPLKPKAKVETKKMDSLDLEPPNLIKIDAQFFEAKIIEGARETINRHKPNIIFENCLDYSDFGQTTEPLMKLKQLGYVFYFPCFLEKDIVIPSEADHRNWASDTLMLVELEEKHRYLYRDTINILACHSSRTRDLSRLFD